MACPYKGVIDKMSKLDYIVNNLWEIIKVTIRLIINLNFILRKRWKGTNALNKNMLVVANGPSLNHIDLNRIIEKDTEIICVNYFPCRDKRFFELKPRYLCILDPCILQKTSNNEINSQNQELRKVLEKVNWRLDIVGSWNANIQINNKMIGFIGLSTIPYHCKFMRKFLYSHNFATTGFQNVAIGALFFAVLSGAKEIYLAGVDNSEFKGYEINEKNEILLAVEHHYGNEKVRLDNIPIGQFTNLLKCYCKMFEQYSYLADYISENTDAKVVNLNPYSFVDVFEKSIEFYHVL